jgi:hypothetical protein
MRTISIQNPSVATINTIQSRSVSSEGIKAFVITCIDFRLIDDAVTYLNSKGYLNDYDEFILAGASLGYNTSLDGVNPQFSGWDKVLENHIDISYTLHKIKEIIVIDHMDCGAYKAQLNGGKAFSSNYEEINQHIQQLNNFKTMINKKYSSKYDVKLWLMKLDGTVDINPTYWRFNDKQIKVSKSNKVMINIDSIDKPLSTLSKLSYKLLDKDGKEISSTSFITLGNVGDTWYIQSINTASEAGSLNSAEYRLQLVDSIAYIKIKMSVESNESDVTFTFEQSDYFN